MGHLPARPNDPVGKNYPTDEKMRGHRAWYSSGCHRREINPALYGLTKQEELKGRNDLHVPDADVGDGIKRKSMGSERIVLVPQGCCEDGNEPLGYVKWGVAQGQFLSEGVLSVEFAPYKAQFGVFIGKQDHYNLEPTTCRNAGDFPLWH
jgi:hypothetical protein